jgi:hypothetical protein
MIFFLQNIRFNILFGWYCLKKTAQSDEIAKENEIIMKKLKK